MHKVIAMNLDVFCHIFFSKAGFSYIDYSKFLRDPRSLSHVHVSKKKVPRTSCPTSHHEPSTVLLSRDTPLKINMTLENPHVQ